VIQRGPLVLCYHALSDNWEHALAVRPRAFERQLRSVLARGYRPGDASGAVAGVARSVHVTFDDAFRSLARALPSLERLGVPSTVFVCPAYAYGGRPLAVPELAADAAAHPDELATMDWETLRELGRRGVEVGSHTTSHTHLTLLSDGELAQEVKGARDRLEDELGRPCRYFAYPYGEHDARVRTAVRVAGYEAAFALEQPAGHRDRFALPRVDLYRRDGLVRATLKTSALRRAFIRKDERGAEIQVDDAASGG
jgi:peptidoglycan/xylan/chitin deacetylase (PgdA/CDA1 family)